MRFPGRREPVAAEMRLRGYALGPPYARFFGFRRVFRNAHGSLVRRLFLKAKRPQPCALGVEPRTLVFKFRAKIGVALFGGSEVLLRFVASVRLPVVLIDAQLGLP